MCVAYEDMQILTSDEVLKLKREYRERFGERFIAFNYADFPGTEDIASGQQYLDALKNALETNTPYHIVSHRYDDFDH